MVIIKSFHFCYHLKEQTNKKREQQKQTGDYKLSNVELL